MEKEAGIILEPEGTYIQIEFDITQKRISLIDGTVNAMAESHIISIN